ncbi:MAG: hypothetical protein PGN07_11380 [Aeromicrobium erythreum]
MTDELTCMNGHRWLPEWRACGICGASSDLPPAAPAGPAGPPESSAWIIVGGIGYLLSVLLVVVGTFAVGAEGDSAFAWIVGGLLVPISTFVLLVGVIAKGVAIGVREAGERR